ncbi:MAG: addiction module protein [Acidobacteriota bacterium]
MMTTATMDIMERVESLPIDLKIELVDKILESISPTNKDVEEAWKDEVERRIDEVERGEVKLIPLEEVRERLGKRYRK